jgi:hypothetical protein
MSIHMTAGNRFFAGGFAVAVALLGPVVTLPSASASPQEPDCIVAEIPASASVECEPVERSPHMPSPGDVAREGVGSGGVGDTGNSGDE